MKLKRSTVQRLDYYGSMYKRRDLHSECPKTFRRTKLRRHVWEVIWCPVPDDNEDDRDTITFKCETQQSALALARVLESENISFISDMDPSWDDDDDDDYMVGMD